MKRFSFKLLAVTLLVAVAAYSCIDDKFDTPPIVELPEGSVLTIQKLKELCPPGNTYKINGDSSLYAVVTMDEMSGNIYRNIFVQDNSGAANLRFGSTSGLYEGDSIRLYLKGAVLSWYNNLFQIDSLHADYNVVKQATERFVEPEVATISQINLDKDYFQSRLVKIEDVQIRASDTASIWAPYQQYGEIFIEDTDGNEMMIRTSGYAKFAGENVPNGFGSIIAIVGLYRETVQLSIRRTSEVKLDGERWVPVLSGSGTKEDPWDVETGISLQNKDPRETGWVKGFIVGAVKEGTSSVSSANDIDFTAPFSGYTNVVIADNSDEKDLSKLLVVNLPSGKPLRSQVNLKDNPSNLGKWINVTGTLRTYFGIAGMRDGTGETSDFEIEGGGGGDEDENPIFSETFATGQGNFTIENVLMNSPLNYIWIHDASYKYMKASAYLSGSNYPSESWLISPAIDLTGKTGLSFAFEHAIGPESQLGIDKTHFTVWISSDYSTGNPNSTTWTQIPVTEFSSSAWNFVSISKSIPVEFENKSNVRFAFKYTSTASASATWEIKNVVVK